MRFCLLDKINFRSLCYEQVIAYFFEKWRIDITCVLRSRTETSLVATQSSSATSENISYINPQFHSAPLISLHAIILLIKLDDI